MTINDVLFRLQTQKYFGGTLPSFGFLISSPAYKSIFVLLKACFGREGGLVEVVGFRGGSIPFKTIVEKRFNSKITKAKESQALGHVLKF